MNPRLDPSEQVPFTDAGRARFSDVATRITEDVIARAKGLAARDHRRAATSADVDRALKDHYRAHRPAASLREFAPFLFGALLGACFGGIMAQLFPTSQYLYIYIGVGVACVLLTLLALALF